MKLSHSEIVLIFELQKLSFIFDILICMTYLIKQIFSYYDSISIYEEDNYLNESFIYDTVMFSQLKQINKWAQKE